MTEGVQTAPHSHSASHGADVGHGAHHRDYEGMKIGMWLFLFTELLLFGGMFLLYAVSRHRYVLDFHNAAKELDTTLGLVNTVVLLTSSLTAALSITALQKGNRKLCVGLILVTLLFGLVFLGIKYVEWSAKIHHGIYPGGPQLDTAVRPMGQISFFALYYVMTGLHGLHVIIGMALFIIMAVLVKKKPYKEHQFSPRTLEGFEGSRLSIRDADGSEKWSSETVDGQIENIRVTVSYRPAKETIKPGDYAGLELTGLYWHLVDIIWIFLFPLFYLIT